MNDIFQTIAWVGSMLLILGALAMILYRLISQARGKKGS